MTVTLTKAVRLFSSLAFCLLTAHASNPHEVLQTSSEWARVGRVAHDEVLRLRIALAQSNLDDAENLLMNVSHPSSPSYGKLYSAEEIKDLFSPSEQTIDVVKSWLIDSDVEDDDIDISPNRAWLAVNLPSSKIEQLLTTRYYWFKSSHSGKATVACDAYYLPSSVQEHIDFVLPGVLLIPAAKRHSNMDEVIAHDESLMDRSNTRKPDRLHGLITSTGIRQLYNIPLPTYKNPNKRNHLGIYENLLQQLYYPDLESFFKVSAPEISGPIQANIVNIDTPTEPAVTNNFLQSGIESALDFEVAWPIIYPQNITELWVSTARHDFGGHIDLFQTLLDAFDGSYCTKEQRRQRECGSVTPPNVISVSYASGESLYPVKYQIRQCHEFMKLALQGVSVLLGSGDSGVENPAGTCLGGNALRKGEIFSPHYPSCPFVTLVGGTQTTSKKSLKETTWDKQGRAECSGSSFSNVFPRPKYQDAAVTKFLAKHPPGYASYNTSHENGANFAKSPPHGLYNRAGRAIPDISALASDVLTYRRRAGGFHRGGGTSAATPIWAGIITRINEERLARGKSPVGFINPVLYENTHAINDITTGHTCGCGTSGFHAVEGWDPATGLGTPDFHKLLDVFLKLS